MMRLDVANLPLPTARLVGPRLPLRNRNRIRRQMMAIVHEERILIWDQGIDDFYGRQPW